MTFAQANDPMTRIQKEAAEAIETVAGWDSEPTTFGALASRPSGVEVLLTRDTEGEWTCEIGNLHTGKAMSAKAAISKVFPEYREYIFGLASDVAGSEDKERQYLFQAMIAFNA